MIPELERKYEEKEALKKRSRMRWALDPVLEVDERTLEDRKDFVEDLKWDTGGLFCAELSGGSPNNGGEGH